MIQGERDNFALAAKLSNGSKLAGIVHSHPGDESVSQVFSPGDLQTANQLKVPSYVRFLKDGSTRKYVPGVTRTRDAPMPGIAHRGQQVADGDQLDMRPPEQGVAKDTTTQGTAPTAQNNTLIPIQGAELTSIMQPTQADASGFDMSNLLGNLASGAGLGLSAYNQQQAYNGLQSALKTIGPTSLNGYTLAGPGGMSSGYNPNGSASIDLGSLNPAFAGLSGAAGAGIGSYNPGLSGALAGNASGTLGLSTGALGGAYGNYAAGMGAANAQLGNLGDFNTNYNNLLSAFRAQSAPGVQQSAYGLQNTLFGNGVADSTGAASGSLAAQNFGRGVAQADSSNQLNAFQAALGQQSSAANNYGTLTNSASGLLTSALNNFGNTNQLISGLNSASLNNSLSAIQGAGTLNTIGLNNYNSALQTGSAQATARNQALFPYASVATALSGTQNGGNILAGALSGAGNSLSGGSGGGLNGLLSSLFNKGVSSAGNSILGNLFGSTGPNIGSLGAAQNGVFSDIGASTGSMTSGTASDIAAGNDAWLSSAGDTAGFSSAGGGAAGGLGAAGGDVAMQSVGTGAVDSAADAMASSAADSLASSGAAEGAGAAGSTTTGLGAVAGTAAAFAPFLAIGAKMFLNPDDVMLKASYWNGISNAMQGNGPNINTGPGGGGAAAKQYGITAAVQEALNTPADQVPDAIKQYAWQNGLVPPGTWGFDSNAPVGRGSGGIAGPGAYRRNYWE